jgi:hypothetical protein
MRKTIKYSVRCLFGFATLLIPFLIFFRTVQLEDVGRGEDQMWWMNVEKVVLLGQIGPQSLLILIPLVLWFLLGVAICIAIERRFKKRNKSANQTKQFP